MQARNFCVGGYIGIVQMRMVLIRLTREILIIYYRGSSLLLAHNQMKYPPGVVYSFYLFMCAIYQSIRRKKMKFSKARIEFYQQVQQYHKSSGLDPRFHRSALEGWVKECGGSPWDVSETDHAEYAEWRKGEKKSFSIPK